jgi:23S rRNA (guanine1835-N2)-methyltransferase
MISPFIINDKNLHLDRFPLAQVNRSLQAWDAADEYLINYLAQQKIVKNNTKILIFNDFFGAITSNFSTNQVFCINDSFISQQGLLHNFSQNGLSSESLVQLTSLDKLPTDINLIIYKIPKSKSLLIEQLIQIKQSLSKDVVFIAADRANDIHSSTLKLFEKHLGTTTTSLAVKKARLVFCQLDNQTHYASPFPTVWPLEHTSFSISNHANVFAREKLDLGARYFIQHLPKIKSDAQIIDLGCGNGVIGLSLLKKHNLANLHFIDESHMAVASAKSNVANNLPEQLERCVFTVNDCLTQVDSDSVDLVLCNPPFHQQQATTDHIAWQMFKDSYRVLKKGGELRIIGNRQLGYHIKLKRLFSDCLVIANNQKFVIIAAIKK